MAHISLLSTLFKFELLISTALIIILLFLGITKREKIISETAISRVKNHWMEFKITFAVGFIGMFTFLVLILLELIEVEKRASFRTLYPKQMEWISFTLVLLILTLNLISLHVVLGITGGGK
jgi:hypothetical protein